MLFDGFGLDGGRKWGSWLWIVVNSGRSVDFTRFHVIASDSAAISPRLGWRRDCRVAPSRFPLLLLAMTHLTKSDGPAGKPGQKGKGLGAEAIFPAGRRRGLRRAA